MASYLCLLWHMACKVVLNGFRFRLKATTRDGPKHINPFNLMNTLEMKASWNGSPRQTFARPRWATLVTTRPKANDRLPKRIPVQWEAFDTDWKIVIKHSSGPPRQIPRLRRMLRIVLSTLRS